jgi:spore cortex formation protein SpoVR/YcgB (stage V sporulation)
MSEIAASPLWTDSEWDFPTIERTYRAIEKIGLEELRLDIYPNQIEIISSEQMIDAMTSIGMPIFYNHWSFGKQFSREWDLYKRGQRGLAYELVINSDPCINYLMESNTMTTQALVLAHAALGHNHFFKNNHLFKSGTDAKGIVDYLVFARDYVAKCEERHGRLEVERFLDSCHALMDHGVDRFRRPPKLSAAKEMERQRSREDHRAGHVNVLDRIAPMPDRATARGKFPAEPEENLLYFCEKYAPDLEVWQRELIRIVRKVAQYFHPQSMTKVANEGCASWVHYKIMNRMHDLGMTTKGSHLEFLNLHTSVLYQPDFDHPGYYGLNPYVLGFEILSDIERAATAPDDEDREWMANVAGCGDPIGAVLDAVANYRDESLIRQYLSPKIIRKLRLFRLGDRADAREYKVHSIHNEQGYADIRETLGEQYEWHARHPQMAVVDVDHVSRSMVLEYTPYRGRELHKPDEVIAHLRRLWTRPVQLRKKDGSTLAISV